MSFCGKELGEPSSRGLGRSILQWILGLKSDPGDRAGVDTLMWQLPLPRAYPPSISSDRMDGDAPFWPRICPQGALCSISYVQMCPGYRGNLPAHHGT